MKYKLTRKNRKSVKVFFEDGITNVYAPKHTNIDFIENAVEKFNKKYQNAILKYQEININEYIYIFGEIKNLKNYNLKEINYSKIKSIFNNFYKDIIINRINDLSKKVNVTYTDITFRKLKSRWGSLDSKGRLKFNYLIFMLSPELIDYLIIHELCHFIEFNHSKQFWITVSLFLPNYKELRKKLKECNYLIHIYK